jgi:glycosyltransferase involved in cell wall biosynthesis
MAEKFLSVITINKNNEIGLISTIESVIGQTFKNFEFIIIDGNSVDNSLGIIEKYNSFISYFISEPDQGIFDAMNKGLKIAKGSYVLFLNSGDYLPEDNIFKIVFENANDNDLLFGNILLNRNGINEPVRYPSLITLEYLFHSVIPHQATYIRRKLFEQVGSYKTHFRIVSDWEWTLRCFLYQNVTYRHINHFIAVYETKGISFQKQNEDLIKKERQQVLEELFSKYGNVFIEQFFSNQAMINKIHSSKFKRIIAKCLKK